MIRSRPAHILAAGGVSAGGRSLDATASDGRVEVAIDAMPVPLRDPAARLGVTLPRLSSRFAQLAVLGAAHALDRLGQALPASTPVVVATGLGDIARTDALHDQVMPPGGEMAAPAQFATSGNNMAGFFVARQAGLDAPNLTFSRDVLSMEVALGFALDALAYGEATQVLCGGVDETTAPRERFVHRHPYAIDRPAGEGSGWLVLSHAATHPIGAILAVTILPPRAGADAPAWAAEVVDALAREGTSPVGVYLGDGIDVVHARALCAAVAPVDVHEAGRCFGSFPTALALALVRSFTARTVVPQWWIHVNRDRAGFTGVVHWRVEGAATGRR